MKMFNIINHILIGTLIIANVPLLAMEQANRMITFKELAQAARANFATVQRGAKIPKEQLLVNKFKNKKIKEAEELAAEGKLTPTLLFTAYVTYRINEFLARLDFLINKSSDDSVQGSADEAIKALEVLGNSTLKNEHDLLDELVTVYESFRIASWVELIKIVKKVAIGAAALGFVGFCLYKIFLNKNNNQ
jgi:preprotein translocase subunit Sss1